MPYAEQLLNCKLISYEHYLNGIVMLFLCSNGVRYVFTRVILS